MAKLRSGRTAVVCEDDVAVGDALARTLAGLFGFEAVTVASFAEASAQVSQREVDLVVLDLALTGERGMAAIRLLLEAAPRCTIVAVVPAPLGGLRADAVAAGAIALVELSDLRPLRRCLEHRYARTHPPGACPSCPGASMPSTAAAFDSARSRVKVESSDALATRVDPVTGTSPAPPPN